MQQRRFDLIQEIIYSYLQDFPTSHMTAMELSRLTEKGQMTIPIRIRKKIGLKTGDVLDLRIEGDHIIMRKIRPKADPYLTCVEESLSEWYSAEDEEAWDGL
jgi:antitoxin PrlF